MNEQRDKSPAFQFYPKDFLSDEKQIRMSLPAVGIYMRLICQCWIEGSLPNDPKLLARMAGATARQFRDLWPSIETCFRPNSDGRLTHPRLERELEKQLTYRQRQTDRANARWVMERKLEQNRTSGDATALPRQSRGSASAMQALQCSSSASSSASKSIMAPAEKAPSPVREFLTWFQGEYKARRHGATYFVRWEAHGAIVKRLLSTFPVDRLKKHATLLLTTNEDWTETTDRGIEVLAGKINWLEDRLARHEAAKRAREAV